MSALPSTLARLTAITATVASAACTPAIRERHHEPPILPVRDSVAAAWETGRRDAIRAYRPRQVPAVLVVIPASAMMTQSRDYFWTMPAAIGGAGAVNFGMARRDNRRAAPEAPDSMRTRYALGDTLWRAYQNGFDSGSTQVRHAYRAFTVAGTILGLAATIPVMLYAPR